MDPRLGRTSSQLVGAVRVLSVHGELDLLSSAKLSPDLNEAVRSGAPALVVDLGGVSFMDSTGLALLLGAMRRLEHAGRRLAIVCPEGDVRRSFEIVRLHELFDLHPTREAALAAVRDAIASGAPPAPPRGDGDAAPEGGPPAPATPV